MLAIIGGLGMPEILLILGILLLLFGSTRLPQLARGMGKSISEFKKGIGEGGAEADRELADSRREQIRGDKRERIRDEDLASDKFTANKPR
jgi:sec-independent protein translocase protein TatA